MKHARLALAAFTLLVTVGCSNPLPAASPTPPSDELLEIYHSKDTIPLIDIVETEFESNYAATVEANSNNHQALVNQLMANNISYFISHHLPLDASLDLWSVPLVQDGLVIVVHPDNPISNLSLEQIQRVYRGFIPNWRELGGEDMPIDIYSREAGAGIRLEFERLLMGQQQTTPNAQVLASTQLILDEVASNPNAIAYLPLSLMRDDVKILAIDNVLPAVSKVADSTYALRMTIYAMGLTEPTGLEQRFFIFAQSLEMQASLIEIYAPLPN